MLDEIIMKITREETYRILWNQLQNSKFKEIYISLELDRFQKKDRIINIFLVIVTSTSISAWAIWQYAYLKWIWALLIAASQIISLIKPYLNYSKYLKELNQKYVLLQTLTIEYERLWLSYKFEKLSNDQAVEKAFDLKNSIAKELNFSEEVVFTENKMVYDEAKRKLGHYLISNYNIKQ